MIKNEEKLLYCLSQIMEDGKPSLWKLTFEPFEKKKTEKIKDADGGDIEIRGYKDHYYALSKGTINKLDLDKNSLDKVEMNYPFTINMNDEFNQMFYEAWAI